MRYYDYLCIYICLFYWNGSKPKTEYIYLPLNSQVVLVIKNLPANVGDARDSGSIPGLGRSPGVENGDRLQYSCLENSMDKGAWWAIVHRAAKSQTLLSDLTISLHFWLDRVMLKVLSNAEPIETQTCFISITFCETFCENLATD